MQDSPRPDVIINYNFSPNNLNPTFIAAVRPESNEVSYEKVILRGLSNFSDIVYLANLNGRVLVQNCMLFDHYASQFKFAVFAKAEMQKYPEMVERFEDYFGQKFDTAQIIGGFDAVMRLNKSQQELFDTIVDEKDFLYLFGQTIKKIDDCYVVNANLPSIMNRYTPDVNVFVVAARSRSTSVDFEAINNAIFDQMQTSERTPFIDNTILQNLSWTKRIKRTFHLSSNYINGMFDMIDYIVLPNNSHISYSQTPLGYLLIEKYKMTEQYLDRLKNTPLVYLRSECDKKILVELTDYAQGKSIEECIDIIGKIVQ